MKHRSLVFWLLVPCVWVGVSFYNLSTLLPSDIPEDSRLLTYEPWGVNIQSFHLKVCGYFVANLMVAGCAFLAGCRYSQLRVQLDYIKELEENLEEEETSYQGLEETLEERDAIILQLQKQLSEYEEVCVDDENERRKHGRGRFVDLACG